MSDTLITGYNVRAGSILLDERFGSVPETFEPAPVYRPELGTCTCGDTLAPSGKCLNVGDCRRADRAASRQSLARGSAASARTAPAAWTISGRTD